MAKGAKAGEEVVMGARYLWLLLALTLAFTGLGQWVIWEENFETQPLSTDYKTRVGWHIVDRSWFYNEPPEILAFPSGSRALYFGKIVNGRGTYDAGIRVSGQQTVSSTLRLPKGAYQLQTPSYVRVSFKYVREVEYYQWKSFDKTEASLGNLDIFSMSSKDPSEKLWKTYVHQPSQPLGEVSVGNVEFKFDSVDGTENNFFGWLIDDVRVEALVAITTLELQKGRVGQTYSFTLSAVGGVTKNSQYKWKVEGPLPEGLSFRDGKIEGTPRKAGAYQVKVTVTDYASEASNGRFPDSSHTRIYTLIIDPEEVTSASARFFEDFENGSGPDIPGWTRTGLWHRTNAQTVSITSWVAYFGKDEHQTPHYNEGIVRGELTSPKWNVADRRGQEVSIEFRHRREVEPTNFPGAPTGFDRTYVQIRFDDGEWKTVWYKDSRDPSQWDPPETVTIDKDTDGKPIVVPLRASTLQIRFVFDSVDEHYNNYRGWAVDNVSVAIGAGRLEIITRTLPLGQVGVYYEAQLQARGGVPPYIWVIAKGAVDGLQLTRDGKLYGVPTKAGDYKLTIEVRDQENTFDKAEFSLTIASKILLFSDDLSPKLDIWTFDGLWHRADQVKGVNLAGYGYVAYFGKDDFTNPNYSTGARVMGYLTSKSFPIDEGVKYFKLTFDYWREVEFYAPGGYDKTYVEVRFLIGTTWSQWSRIWYKDSAHTSEKTWNTASVGPYPIPAGATEMQIRFAFDSVDRFYNYYVGWLIDNVKVEIATDGTPLPTSSLDILTKPRGDFAVFNVPNPVRDVHTTTFVVRGVEADLIKVEVYDLTGRLVYVGQALGNELVWHTQDLLGRYLANGVYLYKVYAKVGDTWIVSDVQKIVILR